MLQIVTVREHSELESTGERARSNNHARIGYYLPKALAGVVFVSLFLSFPGNLD